MLVILWGAERLSLYIYAYVSRFEEVLFRGHGRYGLSYIFGPCGIPKGGLTAKNRSLANIRFHSAQKQWRVAGVGAQYNKERNI